MQLLNRDDHHLVELETQGEAKYAQPAASFVDRHLHLECGYSAIHTAD